MVNKFLKIVLIACFIACYTACSLNPSKDKSEAKKNSSKDKSEAKNKQRPVVSYENEVLHITFLDKKSHKVQISINGKAVQNKTTIREVYKANICEIAKEYEDDYEIALLATTANLRGEIGLPINVKVDNIVDTNIYAEIKPMEKLPTKSSIVGKCAKLVTTMEDPQQEIEIKKWLFRRNEHVAEYRLKQMVDVINRLNDNGYVNYVTNDDIPVIKSLAGLTYRVQSSLEADHYVLFAASSDSEIQSFVEEVVANDFELTVKSLSNSLDCYRTMNSDGHKCITLIGINNDWSYSVVPLGLVAIDNVAPRLSCPPWSLDDFSSIDLKGSQRVILPSSKPEIDGYADVRVQNWDGNGYICNVTFKISFSGDVKSVTIIRDKKLSAYEYNPEKKVINLSGKTSSIFTSSYIFNYDLHFEDGDNIISYIVEDYHGNKEQSKLIVNAEFVWRDSPSVEIDNNINVW